MKNFLFLLTFFLLPSISWSQSDPLPAQCGGASSPVELGLAAPVCTKTSSLWNSNARHIPNSSSNNIKVKANFIIVQKIDGTGNFQDIPEHRAFLDDWFNTCNARFENFVGTSNCSPLILNAKVQIVPNWIFLRDPDPTEFNWNNDNQPDSNKCPGSGWWLNGLDATLNANSAIPRGINVYLTVDGSVYNQMVVLGTINNPETAGMTYTWCSEWPSKTNLNAPSRINVPNLFLKYWWFQNHPNVIGQPFSVTRQWVVNEGNILAHEFGHSFIDCYVHKDNCSNHLMTTSGGNKDILLEDDAGCIHRNLALSNLRQFIDCTETYNPFNTPASSTTFDRVVSTNELWDINMRVYSNVTVKTGATLTVSCKLLMPFGGIIKVERGAKLIVDGGIITRANTCSPSQYWNSISVAGNSTKIQPLATGTLATDDAGIVMLRNQGMLEGAIVGVTTQRISGVYEPEFWGALVDVNDFTFQDCRKGVEFMKYDITNFSKFNKATFTRTATGTSHTGVSIWDTDGILFEECTFTNMVQNGIRAGDAIFNVKKKNKFNGSEVAILAGASLPLQGQIQVGVLGLADLDRNQFKNNVVGIRSTSNNKLEIFSNDFQNSNFDIAINGTTQSAITDNTFNASAAGNQFDNTGDLSNQNLCNTYTGNNVGTNIVGTNTGFLFRQDNFTTQSHDLFIEGTTTNPGAMQGNQGGNGSARWNYFSANKPENIKTSTIFPNNNTVIFNYFHPNPIVNNEPRLKPLCAINDNCPLKSNFINIQASGGGFSNCIFPNPPCKTRPCLEAARLEIAQKTAEYGLYPTDTQKGELQKLTTDREFITDELVRDYMATNDWTSVETMLNEDLNPANRRRLVGAKLIQKQFVSAKSMLDNFPQTTLDDQYFVQVQSINTARLNDPNFVLSTSQESTLSSIAEASSKEAGYAQSLLGILTGRVFMPKLPVLSGERVTENIKADHYGFRVSPNPASEELQVIMPRIDEQGAVHTLELLSLATGQSIFNTKITDQEIYYIPVAQLPSGIYVVQLRNLQSGAVSQQKVIVQH